MPTDPMPVQTSAVRYDPVRAEQHSDEDFRALIRGFLSDHHPGRPPHERTERLEWQKRWLAMLFDAGFAGPNWPREFGGMDLSFGRQLIYQEEYARAKVPGPLGNGVGIAAPTIMRYGTKEQQRRFLGPMLRGDRVWCQGFRSRRRGQIFLLCGPQPAVTVTTMWSMGRRSGPAMSTTRTPSTRWCVPVLRSRDRTESAT